MCIISKVYIIENYRVFDYTVIAYKYITEQNRILYGSVDNTSTGYQAVLYSCTRIIFCRWHVCNFGLDCRFLFKEIITDLWFQEIHICLIISLCSRDVIPVGIDLISINSLQILISDENIIYKIMSSLLGRTLDQLNQLSSADDIDTCRHSVIRRNNRFLLKFLNPAVFIHTKNTKSLNLALILACGTYNGNVCTFRNMILQNFIVIQLVDSIAGSNYNIRFMAVLKESQILINRISSSLIP